MGLSCDAVFLVLRRCGSVIVNLVLRFNQSVSENEVILILKDGARSGSFGQFTVDPDSVKLANTGRGKGITTT